MVLYGFSQGEKQTLECSVRKGVLGNFEKFAGKHLRQSLFFNKIAGLNSATSIKKEALVQVFSCEFYEISKKTFFKARTVASVLILYDETIIQAGITCKKIILLKKSSNPILENPLILHTFEVERDLPQTKKQKYF